MIATIKDMAMEPNQESAGKTAQYLEACHSLFEKGLLSRSRINSSSSQVLTHIKTGMKFFEEWAYNHNNQGKVQ